MAKARTSPLLGELRAELAALESQSQLRHLAILPETNFCSNDYLALSRDDRLRRAAKAALEEGSAVGATGSRLLSGNATIWESLEAELAQFAGAEAALYCNSGYAANVGLFGCIAGPADLIFSDSANHASIVDGIRLSGARKVIFPHLDLGRLEEELRKYQADPGRKIIAVESVFSMDGDRAPLADLAALAVRWGAALIVDDAHATGVFGEKGRGLASDTGPVLLATVHTCGKALAGVGAYVCGSETLKQFLINRARTFIFSTALPPYVAAQMRAVLPIVGAAEDRRAHLINLGTHLRARLRESGFDVARSDSQIVPVVLGANERAVQFAERLCDAGFAVRAIRPPTVPAGTARLRLSLHAGMSVALLDALVSALVRIRDEMPAPAYSSL